MKILSLNCQKAYNENLKAFLLEKLESEEYDFLLLQESTEKVLAYIRVFSTYKILTCTKDDRPGLVCIVYKNTFSLESSRSSLWPRFHSAERVGKGHISFGIVSGIFSLKNKTKVQIASVHLPAGISVSKRLERFPEITQILSEKSKVDTTIFGGDFNFCYPGELTKADGVFLPDYECVTGNLPATLNSCYTERLSDSLCYRFVTISTYLFSLINICIKFKTDHIFVDQTTTNTTNITTKILTDRVSDHSPVELRF